MHQFVAWLSSNTATLSILGAAIAFIWSTTQQLAQRKAEAGERQFQAFHEIVEKVVSPERTDGVVYMTGKQLLSSNCVTSLATMTSRNACW